MKSDAAKSRVVKSRVVKFRAVKMPVRHVEAPAVPLRPEISPEARALPLIELISRAATEPEGWNEFVGALSAELDDAAVLLTIDLPSEGQHFAFRIHSSEDSASIIAGLTARDEMPWSFGDVSRVSFSDISEKVTESELRESALYREYMEPGGLAPRAPLTNYFGGRDGYPLAGVGIFQRVGKRPPTSADLEWLDLLVPHLTQAYEIHATLLAHSHRESAYQHVLDRFPIGVILLDDNGTVLMANGASRRIAAVGDGFAIVADRMAATIRESDVALQHALVRFLARPTEAGFGYDAGFTIDRPSGLRPFWVMFSRLLAGPQIGAFQKAVAVVFISDPEFRQLEMRDMLTSHHNLTVAEIELASLICEGQTLESAAAARGVSVHTARSQLKRIFQKTGTKRQADLVGLLAGGLTRLRRHAERD